MSKARIDGITERIIAKADEDLRKEISNDIEPIAGKVQWYARLTVRNIAGHNVEVDAGQMVNALKEHAFEHHCETHRVNALNNFLKKVESLSEQVEEIRQNIEQ